MSWSFNVLEIVNFLLQKYPLILHKINTIAIFMDRLGLTAR